MRNETMALDSDIANDSPLPDKGPPAVLEGA